MESPAKKLDFEAVGKENMPATAPIALEESDLKKSLVEVVKPTVIEAPKVAPGIKPTEAHEPLLQENPQRFVLFPIRYHEVRDCQQRVTRKVDLH